MELTMRWKSRGMRYCKTQNGVLLFLLLFLVQKIDCLIRNLTYEEREAEVMRFRIIPEVIKTMPKHHIKLVYLRDFTPNYGNSLKAANLEYAPYKVRYPCEFRSYYTLMMIDPDVPSAANPTQRSLLQWLVVNIKATFVVTAQELAKYMQPDPEEGTGLHRNVFILYKQPKGIIKFNETDYNDLRNLDARYHFSVDNFAKKYNLGEPYGVNFFVTKWRFKPSTEEPWDPVKYSSQEDGPWDGCSDC